MAAFRVAIIGLGTVGQGVVELLQRHRDLYAGRCGQTIEVVAALVRDTKRVREHTPGDALITSDPESFFRAPSDLIIEVAGGVDPAGAYVRRSLESGRDVVTANKSLLAVQGLELSKLAEKQRRRLLFEAAVAGGVPVIQTLADSLASSRVTSFVGILNGTCNFILGALERGESFGDALAEAQRLGFAEADPTLDVSGRDSLEKLVILGSLAFGISIRPEEVSSEGITRLTPDDLRDAERRGETIKLIAAARRSSSGVLELWNGPAYIPKTEAIAHVSGANMGLQVITDTMKAVFMSGDGAGRFPTASAVVADVLRAARLGASREASPLNIWPLDPKPARVKPITETIQSGRRGALIYSPLDSFRS